MDANAVATRIPALAPISNGDMFLHAMAKPLNAQALDLIDSLSNKGKAATAREWWLAQTVLSWPQVSNAIWRCIALMTCNNPLGQWFFQGALVRRAIHFEDFLQMADTWENADFHSTRLVFEILREAAAYCGRQPDEAEALIVRIANSGPLSYEAQRWWRTG